MNRPVNPSRMLVESLQLGIIIQCEIVDKIANQAFAGVTVERIEIPSPCAAETADDFGLREQADLITAHKKCAAIEVASRVGTKPHYQRGDLFWSAVSGDVPPISQRIFAERPVERSRGPDRVSCTEILHRLS
jgi:hypothetical protein